MRPRFRYALKLVRLAKLNSYQRGNSHQELELVSSSKAYVCLGIRFHAKSKLHPELQVKKLQHPFIVKFIESWMHQTHTICCIYSYCTKGDLSAYMTKIKVRNCTLLLRSPLSSGQSTTFLPWCVVSSTHRWGLYITTNLLCRRAALPSSLITRQFAFQHLVRSSNGCAHASTITGWHSSVSSNAIVIVPSGGEEEGG
jgi:hypothetical protein